MRFLSCESKGATIVTERTIVGYGITAKLNGKPFRVRTNNPELTGVVDAIVEAIVSNRGFR